MAKNYYFLVCLFLAVFCTCTAQPGNLRQKVTKTFSAQVGIREKTGNNDGKDVEMYLHYVYLPKGNPWCAAFVCWTLGQNNVVNPRNGYCPALFLSRNQVWKRNAKNNKDPQPGDVFGIYFPEKKRIAHVGFVEVWGAQVTTTVEGNTNMAGSREGDGVYRKKRLTRQIYAVTRFIP